MIYSISIKYIYLYIVLGEPFCQHPLRLGLDAVEVDVDVLDVLGSHGLEGILHEPALQDLPQVDHGRVAHVKTKLEGLHRVPQNAGRVIALVAL